MKNILSLLLIAFSFGLFAQSNTSPTYDEIITAYKSLADKYPKTAKLITAGPTDSGKPLHLFIIDASGNFTPTSPSKRQKPVCMIMNGIHPGEPAGINASIAFAEEKLQHPDANITYCIIPVYNIGGSLNRSSTSRANQYGPEEYGFRGNAKNLDLNRDFIKCDSKNTLSFTHLFHEWKPEIFIDTHTSNGADYQANFSLISTFSEKLDPMQAKFLEMEFNPFLYKAMSDLGDEMVPYVNAFERAPDSGISAFTDLPRYSMGYAALFNCFSFTTEAHMLKPFDVRVKSTLNFLKSISDFINPRYKILLDMKRVADRNTASERKFKYGWKTTDFADSIAFPGFKADTVMSEATGLPQLVYNRSEPFRKNIAYYNKHEAQSDVQLPSTFVIPQAWSEIISRLEANGVVVEKLSRDTVMEVTATYIDDFKTVSHPYEGRYLHYDTKTVERRQKIQFYAGDYLIKTNQTANRYLAQVLTPGAEDSFFNWGFFDAVLGQKEYFSSYIFHETAAEILRKNPTLRRAFEEKKKADAEFSKNARAQLDYIYKNSVYYEASHGRLPVYGLF